jgi:hypothetical protein
MQDEQRVFQTNVSYLQNAALQPRSAHEDHSAAGKRPNDQPIKSEPAKPVLSRNVILRLIQTLKDK